MYFLGRGLREVFQYEEAARLFLQRYIKHGDCWSLLFGYMSLFEGGLSATLQEWEASPVTPITPEIRPFYLARKAIVQKDTESAMAALAGLKFGDGTIHPWFQQEAEVIRADALLLAGRKKEAASHAFKAWYLNPRSKRTAYLVGVAAEKERLPLTRFAHTACFIFPGDDYWSRALMKLTQNKPFTEKRKTLRTEFKRLRDAEAKTAETEKLQFWLQTFPFTVEYLCLQLVQDTDAELREEALRCYLKYALTVRGLSDFQAVHLRVFFLQLVRLLPDAEQEAWIDQLDQAWEGFVK
jgi:hypothetical protein